MLLQRREFTLSLFPFHVGNGTAGNPTAGIKGNLTILHVEATAAEVDIQPCLILAYKPDEATVAKATESLFSFNKPLCLVTRRAAKCRRRGEGCGESLAYFALL